MRLTDSPLHLQLEFRLVCIHYAQVEVLRQLIHGMAPFPHFCSGVAEYFFLYQLPLQQAFPILYKLKSAPIFKLLKMLNLVPILLSMASNCTLAMRYLKCQCNSKSYRAQVVSV